MKTTSLIVEIVVVGVLGTLALLPIFAASSELSLYQLVISIGRLSILVQLGIAYALGVLWNSLCNAVFKIPEGLVQDLLDIRKAENQSARIYLSLTDSPLNEYLVTVRGLIRVTRASCVLFLFYVAFGLFQMPAIALAKTAVMQPPVLWTLVLLCLGIFSWWRLYRGYLLTIRDSLSVKKSTESTNCP